MRKAVFGSQAEINLAVAVAAGRGLLAFVLLVFQQVPFVDVEIDVDRILADHRRQQSLVAGANQVADIDQMTADATADRGIHTGVGELQARRLQGRLGGFDSRRGLGPLGARGDHFHLAHRVVLEGVLLAGQGRLGETHLRPAHGQLGLGLVEPRLVGAGVDDEQQIALVDVAA